MRSWEAQRTLRGSDGSWKILRGLRSTEAVFSGPEAVLRGSRRVLMGPVGLMGTERYWGIKGFARGHVETQGSWGIKRVLRGPEGSYRVMMDLWWNIFTPQTPMTSQEPSEPSNPTGFLRTCWTPGPPRNIRTPQNHLRTASGPLNTPSLLLGHRRTLQDPSGPLRVLWAPQDPILRFYQLVKK